MPVCEKCGRKVESQDDIYEVRNMGMCEECAMRVERNPEACGYWPSPSYDDFAKNAGSAKSLTSGGTR
ncbi:hypothetical protein RDV78_02405 [Bacillota bacterium LX-D]|nr:hypothetical protein [Bacillota bacterium LX-D]